MQHPKLNYEEKLSPIRMYVKHMDWAKGATVSLPTDTCASESNFRFRYMVCVCVFVIVGVVQQFTSHALRCAKSNIETVSSTLSFAVLFSG